MLSLRRRPGRSRRPLQSGLSIVELMVGVAIGLVIVAAASLLMTGQLVENRRLLTETQLQQDLRATSDLMTRDLRRAGSVTEVNALKMVWYPEAGPISPNGFALVSLPAGDKIDFRYEPGGTPATEFGYELTSGTIRTYLGSAAGMGWQSLTDNKVMVVDSLAFTKTNAGAPIRLPCAKPCPGTGDDSCWPAVEVREIDVEIKAHALRASEVQRTMRTRVRLRNDIVSPGACPE